MASWTWTDGWILAAIALGDQRGRGATLADMIAAADAIQHAILTGAEVGSAVAKLLAGQVITEADGRYRVASRRRRFLAACMAARGGLSALPDRCLAWLRRACRPPEAVGTGSASAWEAEVEAAHRIYVRGGTERGRAEA
jgi:hypothetical protein